MDADSFKCNIKQLDSRVIDKIKQFKRDSKSDNVSFDKASKGESKNSLSINDLIQSQDVLDMLALAWDKMKDNFYDFGDDTNSDSDGSA